MLWRIRNAICSKHVCTSRSERNQQQTHTLSALTLLAVRRNLLRVCLRTLLSPMQPLWYGARVHAPEREKRLRDRE